MAEKCGATNGADACILPASHSGDAHEGERLIWGGIKLTGKALERYQRQWGFDRDRKKGSDA